MTIWTQFLSFVAGETPFSKELQALAMAIQGAKAVRKGPNQDGKMHPFHAFALTTIIAFGGGWMGFFVSKCVTLNGAVFLLVTCR
jgi:hypothetical protein